MWVGDAAAQRLMAYRMDTKARDAAKDFSSLGFAPAGFHADATHMWINDRTNNRVVAFRLDTRTLDSSRGAGLTGINGNRGLHVENGIAWASFQNAGITAYVMAEPCNPAANPPTALGSALGTAPGATLSIFRLHAKRRRLGPVRGLPDRPAERLLHPGDTGGRRRRCPGERGQGQLLHPLPGAAGEGGDRRRGGPLHTGPAFFTTRWNPPTALPRREPWPQAPAT